MLQQNFRLSGFVLALTLVGCSVREAPLPSNVPPPAGKSAGDSSGQDETHLTTGNSSELKSVDITKTQSLKALADELFDPKVYGNKDAAQSGNFFTLLRKFHEQLLALGETAFASPAQDDPDAPAKIIQRYKEIIFSNCQDLTGTCENLKVFGRETRFSQVLEMMAAHEPNVLEYYRYLRLSLERFHSGPDQTLDILYIKRAKELVAYYHDDAAQKVPKFTRQASLAALSVHSRLFQNALQEFDPAKTTPAERDLIVKNFEPFKLSRNDISSVLNGGNDKLLGMAAEYSLYTDVTRTKLNPDFVKEVNSILESTEDSSALGIRAILKDIQSNDSRNILTNFGLVPDSGKDPFVADEYLYLVDRLYYSHFSDDDAAHFWQYTTQDKKRLFAAANQFVRIQIAYMIVLTNQRMNDFFQRDSDRFKDPLSLIYGAIDNSLAAHADWDRTLNTRVVAVSHFVDRLYGTADPFSLAADDPYKTFQSSIRSLQHNIKMLSVYPNMMMLVYLVAKQNLSGTIQTFWGDYTITAYDVIRAFFVDVLSPWFNFGTDQTSLTRIELLYAMHFALQTETFAAYKHNKMVAVSEGDFLSEVINKFMNKDLQDLKDRARKMNEFTQTNMELSEQTLAACREEEILQPIDEKTGNIQPRTYSRVFNYTDMSGQLANGFGNASTTPLGVMANFYTNLAIPTNLLALRTAVEERLLFLRNLSSIISDYLKEHGIDEAKATEAYQAQINELNAIRDGLVLQAHKGLSLYGGCDILLYKHEMAMRKKIFQMEEDYLGQIYDQVSALNATNGNMENMDDLIARANDSIKRKDDGLPASIRDAGGYDRFVKGTSIYYTYNQFDALLRVRENIKKLAPQTTITLPMFEKLNEFQSPTPFALEISKDTDAKLKRQAFIDAGMRHFVVFMDVPNKGITPAFLVDKLNLMAELYRMGPVTQTGAPGCSGNGCRQVSAEDIIRETLKTEQIAQLDNYDLKILGWNGAEAIHPDEFWNQLVMEKDTRRHVGLLDMSFQRVATDAGTAGPDVDSAIKSHFLGLTKDYYDTEMSVGNFFFAPRPSVKAAIRKNYASYVSDYESKVNEFLTAYEKVRRDPALRVTEIRRARTDSITVPTDNEGLPIYIFADRRSRYDGLVNTFHERTSFEFKNKTP